MKTPGANRWKVKCTICGKLFERESIVMPVGVVIRPHKMLDQYGRQTATPCLGAGTIGITLPRR